MSEDAGEVEQWLHGYLDLAGVLPIGERVHWINGAPGVVIAAALWADGFDLFVASDSLGDPNTPPAYIDHATDDQGQAYPCLGATSGGGGGRRALWSISFEPALAPHARELVVVAKTSGPQGSETIDTIRIRLNR